MNKKVIFISFLLFLLCVPLFALGSREDAQPAPVRKQITGTVRLVGTAMFPEIVVSTNQGEWYIASDEKDKLHNLQHRIVTVEGEETVIELTFASGMPAGTRRVLSNIRVIRIE